MPSLLSLSPFIFSVYCLMLFIHYHSCVMLNWLMVWLALQRCNAVPAPQGPSEAAAKDNLCPFVPIANASIITMVYIHPIYVNTFVDQNTTFAVNDGLTITVEDAPTSLDLITSGTSTSISSIDAHLSSSLVYLLTSLHFVNNGQDQKQQP